MAHSRVKSNSARPGTAWPVFLLAAVSGCAALAHETLWTRRLVDLLGASATSTTRVFACFFLGLSLGAACGPWLLRRVRRPWRAAALLEAGIALAALPALVLPHATGWLWPALGSEGLVGWSCQLIKLLISLAVILPPAWLMGLTLPVLAAAYLRSGRTLGREGISLYAANTAGGILGPCLPILWLLPTTGLSGAMLCIIGLNLLVAAGCWLMSRREVIADQADSLPRPAPAPRGKQGPAIKPEFLAGPGEVQIPWRALRGPLLISALSGAGVLGTEIVIMHDFAQVVPAGIYIPTAVLMAVIAALALSALLAPRLLQRGIRPTLLIARTMLLSAVGLLAIPLLFLRQTNTLLQLPAQSSAGEYFWHLLIAVAVTVGPAMLAAGVVLPLVFAWQGEIDPRGRRLGWLLAANGVGGWLGAELTLGVLLPLAGIHAACGTIAVIYGAASLILLLREYRHYDITRRWIATVAISSACWLAMLAATLFWLPGLPTINPRFKLNVLFERAGRDGAVAVVEQQALGRAILMQNEYVLGSTTEWHPQRRQTLLPLALHANPRDMVLIGFATGITAGGAVADPDVARLRAIELSGSVVTAASDYFSELNGLDEQSRDRWQVIVEDGRTFVATLDSECDVIVSDFFLPWRSGVGRLYSVEHFRATQAALRPGGLFCQWLPMYQLTPAQYQTILRTMLEVYPRVYLFRNTLRTSGPGLALVGFRDGDLDWAQIERNCDRLRGSDALRDPFVRQREGVALLYVGLCLAEDCVMNVPVNTLDNARLETDAMQRRVIVGADEAYLFGENWMELENQWRLNRERDAALPAWVRGASQAGLRVIAWDYLARLNDPRAPLLQSEMLDSLPQSMLADPRADRSAWLVLEHMLPEAKSQNSNDR